jgi:hypothetical protein
MNRKATRVGGWVLLIFLISSLLIIVAGVGVIAADGANPVRSLPATVTPGEQFQVTVTFASPAADFNAIGLDDFAPAGWTVSVNTAWCTPAADVDNTPKPNEAAYVWFGPYASGVTFTAVYEVTVPDDAEVGNIYGFSGTLEYYTAADGPYVEAIGGDDEVEVTEASPAGDGEIPLVNKLAGAAPWIVLGAAIIAGASLLVLRRRRARDNTNPKIKG